MSKKQRVAGYCRTSGEGQRDNTSIPNQKDEIIRFVNRMGWELVGWYIDECKSGSKVEGREDYQRMLRDAAQGKFEAVVVFDLKRFGRSGRDIINDSGWLRDRFNVRVLDTKGHFDSGDRRRVAINYMQAGLAEDERLAILERTKTGKVRTAQEFNAPIGPNRPFGRVWVKQDKRKTGRPGYWKIDERKKRMMQDVARRYVAGESTAVLATECGKDRVNLHRILTKGCGPVWVQRVRCEELGINESIDTQVPPLLDDKTIRAVLARAESNTTTTHGKYRYDYLLSRVVFCGTCNATLSGQTHPRTGKTYYRHPRSKRAQACPGAGPYVPGDDLEETTLHLLFSTFGNPVALQRAIDRAIPDAGKAAEDRKSLKLAEAEIKRVKLAQDRLIDAIADGTISRAAAADKLKKLEESETALTERMEQLRTVLADVPTSEQVRATAEKVSDLFRGQKGKLWAARERANSDVEGMPFEDRRKLVLAVFGGKDRTLGVYVRQNGEALEYTIRGHFIEERGKLFPASGLENEGYGIPTKQDELMGRSRTGCSPS